MDFKKIVFIINISLYPTYFRIFIWTLEIYKIINFSFESIVQFSITFTLNIVFEKKFNVCWKTWKNCYNDLENLLNATHFLLLYLFELSLSFNTFLLLLLFHMHLFFFSSFYLKERILVVLLLLNLGFSTILHYLQIKWIFQYLWVIFYWLISNSYIYIMVFRWIAYFISCGIYE